MRGWGYLDFILQDRDLNSLEMDLYIWNDSLIYVGDVVKTAHMILMNGRLTS